MKHVVIRIVALLIVMFLGIAIGSVSRAGDTAVPDKFNQYWNSMHKKLKNKQYELFFKDALWPQRDGYSATYKSKQSFIKDCNKYWLKNSWKNPKIYLDKDRYVNPKNEVVICVEFQKDDIMFKYVEFDGTYKLAAVFTNLAGGD
jgi:hypothetical protein